MAIKELIVVLTIALFVFAVARPVCIRFIAPEAYDRRRAVWLTLTVVAFVVPSFWLYVAVAAPLMAWLAKRDSNPQALLLMFFLLVPPNAFKVPLPGLHFAFELNQLRLFSLVVIIPWLLGYLSNQEANAGKRWRVTDTLLCLLLLIQIVPLIPHESVTNTARRSLSLFLDAFLVLYFMSRIAGQQAKLVDAALMLCLVCAVYAPLAVFEHLRSWSLYGNLYERWGAVGDLWNLRDGRLRALVSTGHALTLGSLLAMAICIWFWFRPKLERKLLWLVVVGALLAGLLATNSRGPWLMAFLGYLLVTFLTVRSLKDAIVKATGLVVVLVAVLMSPLGDHVIRKIPFIGEDEWGNVAYRVRLAEMSWQLAWDSPFFGDPFVTRHLEELRQAQGIIDLVNAYATVAMFHGFIGLGLYLGIFGCALYGTWKRIRSCPATDADMRRLGIVLTAAMISTLFFMATAGFAVYQYALAGLLISYAATSAAPAGKRAGRWALGPA
jgi:O-Antigen ligase